MAVLALFANGAGAQGFNGERMTAAQERIEAQRVAFITQKMELTAAESAAFWPVYNEFRQKQKALRDGARPGKGLRMLNDAEAQEVIDAQLQAEAQLVQLKREYFAKLSEIVPPRKLVRLTMLEQQFSREVLNTLRQRKAGNRN